MLPDVFIATDCQPWCMKGNSICSKDKMHVMMTWFIFVFIITTKFCF